MTNHWPFGSLWRFTPGEVGDGRGAGGHTDATLTFWWITNFLGFFPFHFGVFFLARAVSGVDEVAMIMSPWMQ